jgi:2-methylcitrate dehydratase PrpD
LTTIGATAAACVVLDVDAATARAALTVATSMASGLLEFTRAGGTVNHLHTGKAALLGILAVDAAAHGFSGPATAFEGEWGLRRVQTKQPAGPWPGIDDQWRVLDVISKPYPTCRAAHPPIAAAERLHVEFARRDVPDEVVVRVPLQCFRQTDHPDPADLRQRQFSTQFGVAVALTRGDVGLADYQDERRVAAVQPLMRRVRLVVDDDAPASRRSATVTLRYADGRDLVAADGDPDVDGEHATPAAEQILRRRFDRQGAGSFERVVDVVTDVCRRRSLGSASAELAAELTTDLINPPTRD